MFDSWVGGLSPLDYELRVWPAMRRLFDGIGGLGVPSIHFAADSAAFLETFAAAGGDVIGVDARQSLADVRARIGHDRAVQGNLDPARVLAGWTTAEAGARAVLAGAGDRPGHVFNLGHASPRDADPRVLRDLVALVHEVSTASIRPPSSATSIPPQELATHA